MKKSLLIGLVLLGLLVLGGWYRCPFEMIYHIPCPGCGMTRAYLALFKGDVALAFYYHPLFIMPVVLVILEIFKSKINIKVYNTILVICAILLIVVYVYRLFSVGSAISIR